VTPYTAYLILEDETHRNVPMPMRSMQGFDGDRGAREEAGKAWSDFKDERGGGRAVAGAQLNQRFKAADAMASAPASSERLSRRALGLPSAPSGGGSGSLGDKSKERLVE
jgi:hypothetical protein